VMLLPSFLLCAEHHLFKHQDAAKTDCNTVCVSSVFSLPRLVQ
jgi:hypothetical protein